jgi:hypothetical protein
MDKFDDLDRCMGAFVLCEDCLPSNISIYVRSRKARKNKCRLWEAFQAIVKLLLISNDHAFKM